MFFTHGLYGSPRPVRSKPIVNLWHGDGPKDVRPDNGVGGLIASTYFVGSTQLFSGHQAAAFDVPDERLIVTGNPRTDQFWRPADPDRLAGLGITGPFVVWMPTFRRTRAVGAMRKQSETTDPAGATGRPSSTSCSRACGSAASSSSSSRTRWTPSSGSGTAPSRSPTRTSWARRQSLRGARRSRGLVTDYSSVWVDYLLLDRPMAFLVPDRDSYTRALVPADVLDWVPGEVVGDDHPFGAFLADLDSAGRLGERSGRTRRAGSG